MGDSDLLDVAVKGTLPAGGGTEPRMCTPVNRPRRHCPPEVLSHAVAIALLGACPGSAAGQRNKALLAVLYRSGLRISEALQLSAKGPGPRARRGACSICPGRQVPDGGHRRAGCGESGGMAGRAQRLGPRRHHDHGALSGPHRTHGGRGSSESERVGTAASWPVGELLHGAPD